MLVGDAGPTVRVVPSGSRLAQVHGREEIRFLVLGTVLGRAQVCVLGRVVDPVGVGELGDGRGGLRNQARLDPLQALHQRVRHHHEDVPREPPRDPHVSLLLNERLRDAVHDDEDDLDDKPRVQREAHDVPDGVAQGHVQVARKVKVLRGAAHFGAGRLDELLLHRDVVPVAPAQLKALALLPRQLVFALEMRDLREHLRLVVVREAARSPLGQRVPAHHEQNHEELHDVNDHDEKQRYVHQLKLLLQHFRSLGAVLHLFACVFEHIGLVQDQSDQSQEAEHSQLGEERLDDGQQRALRHRSKHRLPDSLVEDGADDEEGAHRQHHGVARRVAEHVPLALLPAPFHTLTSLHGTLRSEPQRASRPNLPWSSRYPARRSYASCRASLSQRWLG
mmetsp:Transcript_10090/g.19085  ORF Transcript_10090/g.19085 Transcript_10090/m.19085 type:complete len:392 (-) Transcript_10090:3-1178(-)